MTNDYHFSNPADRDDVQGTSWIINESAQGKNGKRSFSQHRAAARIAQQPFPVRPQVVPAPLQGDRSASFVGGFVHAEGGGAPRVLGAVAGALIGATVARSLGNRRARR